MPSRSWGRPRNGSYTGLPEGTSFTDTWTLVPAALCQTSGLQDCQTIKFCLSHRFGGHLLEQPQKGDEMSSWPWNEQVCIVLVCVLTTVFVSVNVLRKGHVHSVRCSDPRRAWLDGCHEVAAMEPEPERHLHTKLLPELACLSPASSICRGE